MDFSNVKLVTHKGCLDGSACAILFLAGGGKIENLHFSYPSHDGIDELVRDLLDSTTLPILIADASISYSLAKQIDLTRRDVIILDHHKSADDLKEFSWCEVDHSRCGSLMLYDYMLLNGQYIQTVLEDYHNLILRVDDNDRWIHQYPDSKKIAALHNKLGQSLFIERFLNNPLTSFSDKEKYLLEIDEYKTKLYIEDKKKEVVVLNKEIDGVMIRVGCVKADNHQSVLGNSICEDLSLNVDVALMVGLNSISLRAKSTCPVDLSSLAKHNGGGGHKLAAGCSLSKVLGEDFLDLVVSRFKF